MKKYIITATLLVLFSSCKYDADKNDHASIKEVTNNVILSSDIKWEMLNPARGDKSPKAGTIWGDRKGTEATGFLAKFVKGFSSPPHIHNVSYRGIVITGSIHNDDPNAEKMWMPPGSYWTQPEGEAHITAANEIENMAYIEIEKGPYLVFSTEEAFDNGERPLNIDKSNVIWLDASDITWIQQNQKNDVKVAFLWGNQQDGDVKGRLIKLPAGFSGEINSLSKTLRAVVIQGETKYQIPGDDKIQTLDPGSSFSSEGESKHILSNKTETIIYVRTDGKLEIIYNN